MTITTTRINKILTTAGFERSTTERTTKIKGGMGVANEGFGTTLYISPLTGTRRIQVEWHVATFRHMTAEKWNARIGAQLNGMLAALTAAGLAATIVDDHYGRRIEVR